MNSISVDEIKLHKNNKIIKLVRGDITQRNTDVIVNAANSYLKHGGGVAAAIARKGGPIIQSECDKLGYVPVGSAVTTIAGNLPCKAIIHAVGPRMGEGNEEYNLAKAVRSALSIASKQKFRSISIPAISSGIYGFPKDKCAKILVTESRKFFEYDETSVDSIEFCIIDEETINYFQAEFTRARKELSKV